MAAEPEPTEPADAAAPVEAETKPGLPAAGSPAMGEPAIEPAATPASSTSGAAPRKGLRRHRFVYKNLTALRYNPLGLVNEFSFGWRVQLVDRNTALFKDSYFALKAHTFLNPAFGRVGPMVELQPLAVLNLQFIYNAVGYFRTFDQLQSFQSPRADYSDTELSERTDQRYAGTGHYLTFSALLQGKVGRVAVRDNVKFYWADMGLARDPITKRQDTVYYDQTLDILHPDRGWVVTNDADVIYLFDFGLRLGARYTLTHAFYRDSMYLAGESTKNPNSPTHRVGPAILYSPPKWHIKAAKRTKVSRKRWYNPTAFLLVQWWAQHRWRTDADRDVSAAVPYVVLGFSFEGDFFP
ncbi:MAG TPA: hypothetical protein VFG69_09990 [Nannocystaceae bacterium]|nr:hypothetical protein [Nannocystaceae bacterium]